MNNYLYNLEYERIVLGRVLLEPNLFEVIQDLSEETFYFEYNKVIYKAMKLLLYWWTKRNETKKRYSRTC